MSGGQWALDTVMSQDNMNVKQYSLEGNLVTKRELITKLGP